MSLGLGPIDAAALQMRTEGWVAGLQLAGLALHDHPDPSGFVAAFAGSNRFVLDYLAEEVLQIQTEAVQSFLLKTSVLDRLCGPLCDAVLDDGRRLSASQGMLETLERANLFVIRLDLERRWYRYHHLFADVLRARLQATLGTAEVAGLHRRASDWLAAQGQIPEAVEHAIAGDAPDQAISLIERALLEGPLWSSAHEQTVGRWLSALPLEMVRANATLCLFHAALVLVLAVDLDGAAAWVDDAERALSAGVPDEVNKQGEIAGLRALMAGFRGDLDRAIVEGDAALAALRPDNVAARANVAVSLCLAHTSRGDLARAEEVIVDAITLGRSAFDDYYVCLGASRLSYIERGRGALHAAVATCGEALEWTERRGGVARINESMPLMSLADLLRERNELDAALGYATDALIRCQEWQRPDFVPLSTLVLARIRQARGELEEALNLYGELERMAPSARWLAAIVPSLAVQLRLAQGDARAAGATAAQQPPPYDDGELRSRPRLLA